MQSNTIGTEAEICTFCKVYSWGDKQFVSHQNDNGTLCSGGQLRILIDAIPGIIILKDDLGRWVDANNYTKTFFQLKNIDFKGKTDHDLAELCPSVCMNLQTCSHTDENVWSAGKPVTAEVTMAGENHAVPFIFQITKMPIFTPTGQRKGLAVYGKDVTEWRQLENALRENGEHCRSLIDQAADGIFVTDHEGYYLDVNIRGKLMAGYSHQELLRLHVSDLTYPEDWSRVHQYYTGRLSQGPLVSEWRLRRKDGSSLIVEVSMKQLADGRVQSIVRDITERKRKEREFQALVENAPDIIARYDRQYRHIYVNPAIIPITGNSPGELIGKTHREMGRPPQVVELWETHLHKVFTTGESAAFDYTYPSPQGIKHLHVKLVPEYSRHGKMDFVLAMTQDITDRIQSEIELARCDRLNLIGEMATGMAHEIRNPMTTVRGFLQMLESKVEFSAFKSYFDVMIEELDRANGIICEFLLLAKNKVIHLARININQIIRSLLPLIQATAVMENKYVVDELNDVSDILLDEKEIRQLILNIAHNGLEAMSPGGILAIQTYADNEEVVLAIHDQGSGIPAELQNKIGMPFFTTKESGTGLGLAVCYSIAARHSAQISWSSNSAGTTFTVRFKKT